MFINTNSDTFDNEVPDEWRQAIWRSVAECDWLDFLLVTKRIGNVARMVPQTWMTTVFPFNVRIIPTICNQEEAERDVPKVLALPCKNGISYEPALGPVDWSRWTWIPHDHSRGQIEWMIPGGESDQAGHPARVCQMEWIRSTAAQGRAAGVAVFVKQLGANVGWNGMQNAETCWPGPTPQREDTGRGYWRVHLNDPAGADPSEWPEDLRVREFPA